MLTSRARRPVQMASFVDTAKMARKSQVVQLGSSTAPRCQNCAQRSTPQRPAVTLLKASAFCVCVCVRSAGLFVFASVCFTSHRIVGDVPERSWGGETVFWRRRSHCHSVLQR
ncbi:hypothetical protein MTO96_018437 [Rhipicephalus appendiculatus]